MATPKTRHAGDRHMFSSPNDKATMERVLATHAPDGTYIHLIPLLQIVEDIMHKANPDASHHGNQAVVAFKDFKAESEIFEDVIEMLEVMSFTINKVSREISLRCIGGVDAHTTTMEILNILSNYGWDAKAVITLAAFALNYGEFWLVAQLYNVNRLAKSVAHLKQLSNVLDHDGVLKSQSDAVNNFIKIMLDLIHCILRFPELPEEYITPETPELVTAANFIPTVVYWIIQSVVGCVSMMVSLSGTGNENMKTATEAWTVSSLAHKISNIHGHLRHQLDLCYNHINEMKKNEAYAKILNVMESTHLDNLKPLKHLIYLKDDQLPLYDGCRKNRVLIEILKKKTVLLFISDLDVTQKELAVLEQMYSEQATLDPTRSESRYEVVWLPVMPNLRTEPWTMRREFQFEELRHMMPWYSVFHPSLLEPAVIKYIKEVWHFNQKPLLVVMDPQGRIVNTNALHMMWIWGSLAFPFTRMREEALWKEETWRIELLADSIEPMIFNWIAGRRYICLYGGDNIGWIRKFTNTARAVARSASIPLEMLYVGNSKARDKMRRNNEIIRAEKLSHVLPDWDLVWFFWVRLESMLQSKLQFGKSIHEDQILREINVMLTYDCSDQAGWAVICRGSNDWMRRVDGDTLLNCLTNCEEWLERTHEIGFLPAINDYLDANKRPHHCNKLILPETAGSLLERVGCTECGQSMERLYMYRCCQGM